MRKLIGADTKIKTSELTGPALDRAVAQALITGTGDDLAFGWDTAAGKPAWIPYSTVWGNGGPIIEREKIPLYPVIGGTWQAEYVCWQGEDDADTKSINGPTPLIAAMRCFVASKLGDEVDVPEELT